MNALARIIAGRLAACTALALTAGCGGTAALRGSGKAIAAAAAAVVDLTDPSKPLPVERFLQPNAALIAPGDQLELRVLGFNELSGNLLVAQDGKINLSLVGSIQASGKTVEQLDGEITTAFATYYRNIDVAVNVHTRVDREVYVLGEVFRPGRYDFRSGERVLHALADGGGMTAGARENNVVLMRRESDGTDHAYQLDFSQMHYRLAPKDIYLMPGDVVFVPKSRFKTASEFALTLLDVLGRATTTVLVGQNLIDRTQALTISK